MNRFTSHSLHIEQQDFLVFNRPCNSPKTHPVFITVNTVQGKYSLLNERYLPAKKKNKKKMKIKKKKQPQDKCTFSLW